MRPAAVLAALALAAGPAGCERGLRERHFAARNEMLRPQPGDESLARIEPDGLQAGEGRVGRSAALTAADRTDTGPRD